MMFELIEYVGALGVVLAQYETLAGCIDALGIAAYVLDGHAALVCEVAG